MEKFAALAVKRFEEYEYDTYLIGTRVDLSIQEREEELWTITHQWAEPIKSELNREIGKLVGGRTGKEADHRHPDIVGVVDTRYDVVEVHVAPLFLYGRYRKLVRGIPQTVWPCRACMGKGCDRCGGTGKMYPTSVQEIIAEPVTALVHGTGTKFHGMGREDIDALMLGNGRPFVIEVGDPKKRGVDYSSLMKAINTHGKGRVEVSSLRTSSRQEAVELKLAKAPKTYRLLVAFDRPLEEEKVKEALRTLKGSVDQRTPQRVAHRRADLVRVRKVMEGTMEWLKGEKAMLRITGESGLYVKELISGDEGRTNPSLAGLLGVGCVVKELDVIEIGDQG